MTQRSSLRLAVDFDELRAVGLRPSVKLATAAAAMDVDISTIYKMIKRGSLEAHRVGCSNGEWRIFVDSINAYQREGDPAPEMVKRPRKGRITSSRQHLPAAHHEAMAHLDKLL